MKKVIHRSYERKICGKNWIRIAASFRPDMPLEQRHFGYLIALDEAIIEPAAKGFGMHPHNNLEIISVILKGQLIHEDSMGNRVICQAGDVQLLSAGTGILHNEYNASDHEYIEMLQIWILPQLKNIMPTYHYQSGKKLQDKNCFYPIIAPQKKVHCLPINQQAYIYWGRFDATVTETYHIHKATHGIYFFVLEGEVAIDNEILQTRDAIGLTIFETVSFTTLVATQLLIIEVPMYT